MDNNLKKAIEEVLSAEELRKELEKNGKKRGKLLRSVPRGVPDKDAE